MLTEMKIKTVYFDMFPVFAPNEYMFTEYRKTLPNADKLERWEVYAQALQDFLVETGGFGINK